MSPALPTSGLGRWRTEADALAAIENLLMEKFGLVNFNRIAGAPTVDRYGLTELEDDPAPPEQGATIYCIGDNGGGKAEIRILFPSGLPQVIATEP